jgi:general secretion pathway protein D
MTASALANPPSMTVGYSSDAPGNIFATIKLLEQFGNARVLSSPKLMALNNQTALLKVVRNQVYFTVQASVATGALGAQPVQAITTTARTVPIGLVMSMTPQINETGQITITVRPTVTSQVGSVNDPNPLLAAQNLRNEIPVVEVREIESVLQVVSGQTAILGGLIKDEIDRSRDQVPGIGNTRAGDLFAYRNELARKSELVIFLRPVVVPNPSMDSDELKGLRNLLPRTDQLGAGPQQNPQGR